MERRDNFQPRELSGRERQLCEVTLLDAFRGWAQVMHRREHRKNGTVHGLRESSEKIQVETSRQLRAYHTQTGLGCVTSSLQNNS